MIIEELLFVCLQVAFACVGLFCALAAIAAIILIIKWGAAALWKALHAR